MANSFHFGQRVEVRAYVWTSYIDPPCEDWPSFGEPEWEDIEVAHRPPDRRGAVPKVLLRRELQEPLIGLIIGRTFRHTGWYWPATYSARFLYECDPPSFKMERQFTVWRVAVDMNEILEVLEEDMRSQTLDRKEAQGQSNDTQLTHDLNVNEAVKSYKAALLKRRQLEREIRQYTTGAEQSNMLHTLSKLWMFLIDEFVPNEIRESAI